MQFLPVSVTIDWIWIRKWNFIFIKIFLTPFFQLFTVGTVIFTAFHHYHSFLGKYLVLIDYFFFQWMILSLLFLSIFFTKRWTTMVSPSHTDDNWCHRIHNRFLRLLWSDQRKFMHGYDGMFLPNHVHICRERFSFHIFCTFQSCFDLTFSRFFFLIMYFSVLSLADCNNIIWSRNRYVRLHQTRWIALSFGQRIQWNAQTLQHKCRILGFGTIWSMYFF